MHGAIVGVHECESWCSPGVSNNGDEWSEVVPRRLVPAAAFWKVPNVRATHPQLGMKKNPYGLHCTWQAGCLVINGQCEIGRALSSYGPAAGPWQTAPHPGRWLEDRWDGMDQHDTEKRSTQSCSRKDQSRMDNGILESSLDP